MGYHLTPLTLMRGVYERADKAFTKRRYRPKWPGKNSVPVEERKRISDLRWELRATLPEKLPYSVRTSGEWKASRTGRGKARVTLPRLKWMEGAGPELED